VIRPAIIAAAIAIALPIGARAQGSMPVGSSGQLGQMSQTEDVPHRAAAAYNRGAREMRKAANAKDPADKKKHYAAAQDHFKKSLDLQRNFDALLGLGQADLALGDNVGARATCRDALSLKPTSTEAKACADTAEANVAPAAPPAPPAATPPAPPAAASSPRRSALMVSG
jgi:tetratricopeptide (TPR) repeat protein